MLGFSVLKTSLAGNFIWIHGSGRIYCPANVYPIALCRNFFWNWAPAMDVKAKYFWIAAFEISWRIHKFMRCSLLPEINEAAIAGTHSFVP